MKNDTLKLKKSIGGYTKKSVHQYIKYMDMDIARKENEFKTKLKESESVINEQVTHILEFEETIKSKDLQITVLSTRIEGLNSDIEIAKQNAKELTTEIESLKEISSSAPDNTVIIANLNSKIEELKERNSDLETAVTTSQGNARVIAELEASLDEVLHNVKDSAEKIKVDAEKEANNIISRAQERAKVIELDRLKSSADSATRIMNKLAKFRDALLK